MEFKTQYDNHERVHCSPGNPIHVTYAGRYDEKGRVVLEESGCENIYDMIQSHAESCDIHVLMKRYLSGDVSALSKCQGQYLDTVGMPTTYADWLNHVSDMERFFMSLPPDVRSGFGNSFSEFLAASCDADFAERLGVKPDSPPPVDPVISEEEV